MADQCPKCGAPVEHDFGVTPCESCGVVLFVDFDGKVQVSTPEGTVSQPEPAAFETASSDVPENDAATKHVPYNQFAETQYAAPADYSLDAGFGVAAPVAEDNAGPSEAAEPMDFGYAEAYSGEVPPPLEDEAGLIAEEPVYDFATNEEPAPLEGGEPVTPSQMGEWNPDEGMDAVFAEPAPIPQTLDFSDVVEFANTAELDNSPLVYKLRIEGIDHKDIRRKVESVLADPKLNFHLKELLPQIKGGVLELHDLSPVKASVIASRLREEAVQFHWTQYVFQTESAEGALGETGT